MYARGRPRDRPLVARWIFVTRKVTRREGCVMAGSVDELRFFAVVAVSETLTAASRELGSSLPVVSKRLAAMERRLGVQLVHRGTRKLSLTSEGALLARR